MTAALPIDDQANSTSRVLAIWLDGFDMRLAERWNLETLSRLARDSAHARLDHGSAHLSGLTGEHLSAGLDPEAAKRVSAVEFDKFTYRCRQIGALHPTAFGGVPTVVFDPCYFDMASARSTVSGVVDWGAHDPGGPPEERPDGLHSEIRELFGEYPARRWIYATPWASPADCALMGTDLVRAVQTRSQITRWLLGDRLPDWQLAFVGVSEAHSATEGLYHGADPAHPLHSLPSGAPAGQAIRAVYEAIDQLVSDLIEKFPDAVRVVFTMHGMGANSSDVPSMVLLGELLRRWSGHETADVHWPAENGVPMLPVGESWSTAVKRALEPPSRGASAAVRSLPTPIKKALRRIRSARSVTTVAKGEISLAWMPLIRHEPLWPSMRAFAIPSFYDGRVRVNLQGREAKGIVSVAEYVSVLDEIEELLRSCRDPISGEPVVEEIERPLSDPLTASPTDADLVVTWAGFTLGLEHAELGTIGPFPPRRTGGHSSPSGACFIQGRDIPALELGVRSSFDVLPTLFALAGSTSPWPLSGDAMLARDSLSPG